MRLDKGSGTIAADRDETSVMLLARMDDGPFALFHDLEQPFVKAFDHSGPTAFERRVRLRFGALAKAPKPEALPGDSPEYLRRQRARLLRAIYLAQADRKAYVALTVETSLSAEDYLFLAMLDRAHGRAQEALAWIA